MKHMYKIGNLSPCDSYSSLALQRHFFGQYRGSSFILDLSLSSKTVKCWKRTKTKNRARTHTHTNTRTHTHANKHKYTLKSFAPVPSLCLVGFTIKTAPIAMREKPQRCILDVAWLAPSPANIHYIDRKSSFLILRPVPSFISLFRSLALALHFDSTIYARWRSLKAIVTFSCRGALR